jgi:hypothetical protein
LKIIPSTTRKTISLFLAFMLIAGTITFIFPSSSFTKEVHAISDYELMKRDDYNSKYVQYNKENIDCTNFNLNGNGLDINTIPESLSGLAAAAQGETGDSEIDTGVYGTKENRFGSYDSNKKDFLYKCINNNDNEFIVSPTPSIPPTPPTPPVDNVCTVWQDNTPGNYDIFFSVSNDGGLTFSEPENISENTENSIQPQVICEGNNVYVVWTDTTPGNADIFFAASNDGGLTFSEPENISENTGDSFVPQISSEGNNVYVVWTDTTPGNGDIFFAISTDGGLTFSDPENISENEGFSQEPQISSEGNNVYVVWTDETPGNGDIFFSVSTDGGLTFRDPENLSESTGISSDPQISSTTSQENPNSEIQMINPPTQQTVTSAATFQQQPVEDSPIITHQGTGEGDLSALEKIEKLKKQWLALLP